MDIEYLIIVALQNKLKKLIEGHGDVFPLPFSLEVFISMCPSSRVVTFFNVSRIQWQIMAHVYLT